MEDQKNSELENLRLHVTKYLLNEIDNYQSAMRQHEDYKSKIKAWCITLYVAAVGFCLAPKVDYSKIYDFLPLLPLIFFWFLNAIRDYFSEQFQKDKRHQKIKKI